MVLGFSAKVSMLYDNRGPDIEESSTTTTTTTKRSSSAYKEQISKTNASAAVESIRPEVFDSSSYGSMAEMKKSANMNESDADKVLLDTEKKIRNDKYPT
jgi:hypothetical protein